MGEVIHEQPAYGIGGWAIEWIGAIVIYLVCRSFLGWDWFKTAAITLLALFWAFLFGSINNWPCNKLKQPLQGTIIVVISFILGLLQWHWLGWTGFDPYVWSFPVISNQYFLYLVTNMAFENAHMKNVKIPVSGILNGLIWFVGTYLTIVSGIPALVNGITASWFPIAQWYFLSQAAWPTRGMSHPSKGIMNLFVVVTFTIFQAIILGLFGIEFGSIPFIAWVATASATGIPLFVFLENYPWRKLRQPYMGLVGIILQGIISVIEMVIFYTIGFPWEEVIALSFSAVTWEFMMMFNYGYGFPSCLQYLGGGTKS